jgi:ATP-binding cassette subfamily B protein
VVASLMRSTPIDVVRRARAGWVALAPFLGGSRAGAFALTGASVLAGFAEAAVLTLIAAIGTSLSVGKSGAVIHFGPVILSAELPFLFAAALVLTLVRGLLQVFCAYLPARMSGSAMVNMRRRLFDAFTATSWSVQASERDGEFQSFMVTHINRACSAIGAIAAGLTAFLMFLTLLSSAFALSAATAIVIILASLGLFLTLRPLSRRHRKWAKMLSTETVEYSKTVHEIVLTAEETQVFGASPSYRNQVYQGIEQVRTPWQKTRVFARAVPIIYQTGSFLLLVSALMLVPLATSARVTALGAVVLILIRSFTYGQQIQTALSALNELTPFMWRVREALDHYDSHPRQDGPEPLPDINRVGMADVHYAYIPDVEVLRGINFEAHKGEAIGIVGPSGAGKSSLVQLLLRLRDPNRGLLLVNGLDARMFRRDAWQHRVAYVPQTPQLVWGTVADNIRFYREDLTDADIESAARRASIHEEIMSWPNGYETVIGQRASAVSGGQRQRLCLARALAGGPDLLILDEPTSALDLKSESEVQRTLSRLKGEIIIFVVAHRLSTLSICDRVMVVMNGRLEAIDHPTQLVTSNGFYHEVMEIAQGESAV